MFEFKTAQNSKNFLDLMFIQGLNCKLGITLRVSVTSATIYSATSFICNHLHGQENHKQKYIIMVLNTV